LNGDDMDIYDAIKLRYSCRDYRDKPVEEDKLQRVLEAARLAPSANNRQAWKIIVVTDLGIRHQLARDAEQPFIEGAPVVLAMVGLDPARTMSCSVPADPVDCAIAIEHLALAATAEGLATCWIGHFDQHKASETLGVPASAKILHLMPLGYPKDQHRPRQRKPIGELVCKDKFRA
jgi:nitroreductase